MGGLNEELFHCFFIFCNVVSSDEINDYCAIEDTVGKVEAGRISSVESGYTISVKGRSYFYSAPDDKCKTSKFIIFKDKVDAYMEYNKFHYIMYFGRNGVTTEGWVKSERLKENGYGVGNK